MGDDGASRVIVATRRGLTDRDLRERIPGPDAGVGGRVELRVVGGGDGLAGGGELRSQEQVEVRLVPDRPEADVGVALEPARVARCDRLGEGREVGKAPRHDVRLLAAVGPRRRPRDREHDLLVVLLCGLHGLVHVREVVLGIERIARVRRASCGHDVPLHEQSHDRRALLRRELDSALAVVHPAEAGIVVEADPHAIGSLRGGGGDSRERRERRERGEREQGYDEAGDASHEDSDVTNGAGSGTCGVKSSGHPSDSSMWTV